MANELMTKECSFIVNGEEVKLTGNTVKKYLTKGNDTVTDQEVVMFINLCRYQKLNPFLNEAYLVKFKGSPAQIITSKEAYMKKAEANHNFDGMRAGLIVQRGNDIIEVEGSFTLKGDILLGAWAEVYRKDRKYPYVSKVSFEEYNRGQSTWKKMPKTMIRKVAIVQALREAFPVDLGALYMEEETNAVVDVAVENEVQEEINEKANSKPLSIDIDNKEVIDVESEEETKAEQTIVEGPGF
ncbi:RecT family protein [Clostridium tepidiprofundi DSM 19306]|uniref:RecT family protein n=1 Tax=Clostridium tepidiprofundi DSM 19306 TaxID=1121338 RepID=A0A151B7I3_9CLOT|nr:phage recombination protein Bet [Clostridium tepidiprofundi]KYH35866.1 RecT family protein [Clostridium tepidiprofundi DSM 19306]